MIISILVIGSGIKPVLSVESKGVTKAEAEKICKIVHVVLLVYILAIYTAITIIFTHFFSSIS